MLNGDCGAILDTAGAALHVFGESLGNFDRGLLTTSDGAEFLGMGTAQQTVIA